MIPAGENQLSAIANDPQRLIRVPVGFVSPFWGLFAGAAMSGAAWWWMTRWARPANLEAAFGAAEAAVAEPEAKVEAAPVMEALEAPAETVEVAVEDAPQVASPDMAVEAAKEPVGGESAPISPVVEAESLQTEAPAPAPEAEPPAKPAARPKKAAAKAD
jgi:hypothetical protein